MPAAADAEAGNHDNPATETAPFSVEDELILELKIEGAERRDTIIAYGRVPEVYLPFGLISRLLDLALTVSPDGGFASGWVLREEDTLTLEAGEDFFVMQREEIRIHPNAIVAFDGEMYVRPELLEKALPIEVHVDLRAQSVEIKTLETFPFQAQLERDRRRGLLASQQNGSPKPRFPRQETPYKLYDIPMADLEFRAVSDGPRGGRAEGEIYVAGDFAAASAEFFVSASSNDGLTAALFELGRDDPDGELLGPLNATSFAVGDVQTSQQPIGLRSSFGRGFRISNAALDAQSVFDEIDLRGVLQDGYEVELYRNGILLGSTDRSVNGQYEFLQVPVDFGINAFRLVFYGPQGQQREEVRTIRVGDGRLPEGELSYQLGVVQNERTLLDIRPSGTNISPSAGSWRSIANLAYGFSSDLTVVSSISLDEESRSGQNIVGTIGMRSGISSTGLRFDAAFASSGGFGAVAGANGQIAGANITLNHGEYSNGFVDEQRGPAGRPLARATDVNVSASLALNESLLLPVIGRLKLFKYADGGTETRASLRASTRRGNLLLSNSLDFVDLATADGLGSRQLVGNFDLATARAERFRARAAVEYEVIPDIQPTAVSLVTDLNVRNDTNLQFSAGYRLDGTSLSTGASALTRLGKSTLAFEGDYDFKRKSHSVALRWGLSFGRNTQGFYLEEPSRAKLGAVELSAFHDRNADGIRDPDEPSLQNLTFFSPSESAETDQNGHVMITGLPANRPTSIQIDLASLPDISLVPETNGFEIVPRRGRIHTVGFPVVSVGEIDGTVIYVSGAGRQPVGGVRLGLEPLAVNGDTKWLTSEADGYFYFEQIRPGSYRIILDEAQASRLQLCLASGLTGEIEVPTSGGPQSIEVTISNCSIK